jgi:hypothetical protein
MKYLIRAFKNGWHNSTKDAPIIVSGHSNNIWKDPWSWNGRARRFAFRLGWWLGNLIPFIR